MAGKCDRCGGDLELLDVEWDGTEIWVCKNDCTITEEVIERLYEAGLAEILSQPETSHCWTCNGKGKHCPGLVERTEETADGPYGHFCPKCGRSLRHHPVYGEGMPKDLAKRYGQQIQPDLSSWFSDR